MQQYAAAPEQRAMIAFPLSIKRPFVSYSVSYSVQSGYKATNRHSSHLIIPKGIDEGVHVRKEGRKEGRKWKKEEEEEEVESTMVVYIHSFSLLSSLLLLPSSLYYNSIGRVV